MTHSRAASLAVAFCLSSALFAQTPIGADQLGTNFKAPPAPAMDYDKRVVMMPMRDGVKLYTVIFVAHGAKSAPMVLTRTPYNAAGHVRTPAGPLRRTCAMSFR